MSKFPLICICSAQPSGSRYLLRPFCNQLFVVYASLSPLTNFFYFLYDIGNVGVPIKLLYEAEGMKVTAEVSETNVSTT